jgi:hypothetical protein
MTAWVATHVATNFRVWGRPVIFDSEHKRKGCYYKAASPASCLFRICMFIILLLAVGRADEKINTVIHKILFYTKRTPNIEVFTWVAVAH